MSHRSTWIALGIAILGCLAWLVLTRDAPGAPRLHETADSSSGSMRVSGAPPGEPSLVSLVSHKSSSTSRPLTPYASEALPLNSEAAPGVSSESPLETGRFLDGGTGPAPSTLMNCHFDGGYHCGSCQTDGDCPTGQGCIINRATRRFECQPNECEEDQHCFLGFVCRVAAGNLPGPLIRRCVPSGPRAPGERCDSVPATPETACQEGLLCVDQFCATPCTLNEPRSCPEGHVCRESRNGPGCVPDCRKLGCPSDQECARIYEDTYQCLRLGIDECDESRPCPESRYCLTERLKGRGGRFCAAACESWKPGSCPDGYVCGRGGPRRSSCYRKCNPQDLGSCPAGWLCKTVSEDLQTWGCRPDVNF